MCRRVLLLVVVGGARALSLPPCSDPITYLRRRTHFFLSTRHLKAQVPAASQSRAPITPRRKEPPSRRRQATWSDGTSQATGRRQASATAHHGLCGRATRRMHSHTTTARRETCLDTTRQVWTLHDLPCYHRPRRRWHSHPLHLHRTPRPPPPLRCHQCCCCC